MSAPIAASSQGGVAAETRKEKRKALKKQKRKQIRQMAAIKELEEEAARSNDPEEQQRVQLREQEEAEAAERDQRAFEERERALIEAAAARRAEEEAAAKEREAEEGAEREKKKLSDDLDGDSEWEYVEEGPAEIIWQGNEIIVKKKKVRVGKRSDLRNRDEEDDERPTSNPLPPQSVAFASYKNGKSVSAQNTFENVAEQVPNFGTEQDKTHCPFHLKTGVCRFGTRCSRAHFYPDKSCILLIKNMYTGPGLAWEQDEGLEYTDEEVEHCYEEFYEDVHTEFLKFGELVNFKVCKNGLHHLRGNVYVHYKSLESALLSYNTINGRFFAGKQISCEFVGVSRWKVAICGEYMKSRSRTCSRGSACNFIHPFRNPGGDYEWADWDNPPPKYWMKKMAFLFGPSVEAGYEEEMKLVERERPWDSNRRTPTNNRHQSRRSTHSEMDMHNTDPVREHVDEKRDSQSPRREHSSRRRKGTYYQHKHGRHEENDRNDIHGYNVRHRTRSSDDDSCKDQDRHFLKKYPKHGEKNVHEDHDTSKKHKREEEPSRQKEREAFHKQGKAKKRHISKSHRRSVEEPRSPDWISESIYDNEETKNSTSSEDSYREHGINVKERYDGRYGSTDLGSDKHSHEKSSRHSKYREERTDSDRYSSRHHRSYASSDHELDSKNSRLSKQDSADHDEYTDGRKITDTDPDIEDTDSCLRGDRSSRSHKKQNKSDRKRKHRRRKEEYCETREQGANSDSDNMESNGSAYKHSRS